jgi:hypothetical protein
MEIPQGAEPELVEEGTAIGLACAQLADAIFPHIMDATHRQKVALALVEFTRAIVAELRSSLGDLAGTIGIDVSAIDARLEGLEKDSHPAVPLRPIIIEEVQAEMRRCRQRGIER